MADEMDDDELLDALGVEAAPQQAGTRTPREERIVAGFEDILRFHQAHGRAPRHGEGHDIFERLYAVRLDQLRKLPQARSLLGALDSAGLLSADAVATAAAVDGIDEDALLAALQADAGSARASGADINVLRHVRSAADKRVAEEVASRVRCVDFEQFQPLFEAVRRELEAGVRKALVIHTLWMDEIQQGAFFIVGGQIAYVAEVGDAFFSSYERRDSRLRVVFDNGTEAEILQRSLQRALHRDPVARLITEPGSGPLFGDVREPHDIQSGIIYVLRSLSDHPFVAAHRELVHKIGVTGGTVQVRIAGADKDATYLLAGVEVVATYALHNVNRIRLENIFHRLFAAAQLDLTIDDRFGNPVKPKEWFLLPLQVIDEAVRCIRDGSITDLAYDPKTARLVSVPRTV